MVKSEEQLFAFVLMPFDPIYNDTYMLGIKEAAKSLNIKAERVDEQIYAEGILERIYRQIDAADVIIADMSGKNPNVFYEVGYAHAKDKLCILLTSNEDDIPFDLKHKRHIIYNGSIQTLRDELIKDLEWAKKELENVKNSRIAVSVNTMYAYLEKTKYSANVVMNFKIDLHNNFDRYTPEIHAAYIYSKESWQISQDGKKCSSTTSDCKPWKIRHLITVPVNRISKNQWAQLSYECNMVVASTFKGEELKNCYPIRGTQLIRLATSEGNFDYEIPVDVTAAYIPF